MSSPSSRRVTMDDGGGRVLGACKESLCTLAQNSLAVPIRVAVPSWMAQRCGRLQARESSRGSLEERGHQQTMCSLANT